MIPFYRVKFYRANGVGHHKDFATLNDAAIYAKHLNASGMNATIHYMEIDDV